MKKNGAISGRRKANCRTAVKKKETEETQAQRKNLRGKSDEFISLLKIKSATVIASFVPKEHWITSTSQM